MKSLLLSLESLGHKMLLTFIETFFGVWVVTDVSTMQTAAAAALAASVVPLKDWLVARVGEDA